MKILLSAISLCVVSFGFLGETLALPIMNENVANHGVITIYPDHQDGNHFYVAPNVVMIARDAEGIPVFLYREHRERLFKKSGLLQMTLVPTYTRAELEEAKAMIVKTNPKAIFSGLPFLSSKISFSNTLNKLVSDNDCSHMAGLIGQEQSCQMILTKHGRKAFHRAVETKSLFVLLQFGYSVEGVVRGLNDTFSAAQIEHEVAVVIDGGQLAEYPELIQIDK